MKLSFGIFVTSFAIASAILISCNKDDTTTTVEDTSGTVPTVFSSNYKPAVTLSASATTVTLKSKGVPDHGRVGKSISARASHRTVLESLPSYGS
jgi:hypothetical protein